MPMTDQPQLTNDSPMTDTGAHELNLDENQQSAQMSQPSWQSEPAPMEAPADSRMKGNTNMNGQKIFFLLAGAVILAGIGTGTGLNKLYTNSKDKSLFHGQKLEQVPTSSIQKGQIFGSPDESTFKDSAEGVLENGGIDGEGSHHLLRPGGPSQTVYLTSSITDLSKFEGMKVKVWGETFKAQKAGWLMDVGRVQVEETSAQPPTE